MNVTKLASNFSILSMLNRLRNPVLPGFHTHFKRYNSNGNVSICANNVEGFAWIKMNKRPVNTMDARLLVDLEDAFGKLENDASCRGVILTSSLTDVFSAGLDISVLNSNHIADFDKMWEALQNLWLRVYCSPLAIIAAINGNAPAGGCMIAIACDHRIMARGNYHIGISAPRLGLMLPPWVQRAMENTIGHRHAEEALGKATLYSVDEAFKLGLIDSIVEPKKLEEAAQEEMNKMLKIPDHARILSKQLMRLKDIQYLRDNQKNDLEYTRNHVMLKETQQQIKKFLNNLKKQKK
ncbi:enoyl-CoA delta isomerase 1, mitochondrial-like [Amphiura filiformis]|uniref:enoyl-CoA delta isomerase 1, mitochondrial-like n=1 Tax=Amphiura filiformis TaxID=82378 RepID=UPI003B21D7C7